MVEIKSFDFVRINNGAHYEFMKVVSDRFATETALSTNAAAKKAIEALAAAVKEEDRCLVISQKSLRKCSSRSKSTKTCRSLAHKSTRPCVYRPSKRIKLIFGMLAELPQTSKQKI